MEYLTLLRSLSAEPFCLVFCVAWGYVVRIIPAISNRWVPAFCIFAGLIYPALLPPETRYPLARTGALGLIIGVAAFVLYKTILVQLENKIPFLKGMLTKADAASEGGSKRYRKKEDGTFEPIDKDP